MKIKINYYDYYEIVLALHLRALKCIIAFITQVIPQEMFVISDFFPSFTCVFNPKPLSLRRIFLKNRKW